jgi:hypothetical protein
VVITNGNIGPLTHAGPVRKDREVKARPSSTGSAWAGKLGRRAAILRTFRSTKAATLFGLLAWAGTAHAESAAVPSESLGTAGALGHWALEVSPTFLLAPIYMAQATWSAWTYGDVVVGYGFQHMTSSSRGAGQTHGHSLLLGYRQFIWKALSLEVQAWPTYDRFQSYVDGRVYPGVELWCEAYLGYRFDFVVQHTTFYIMPQPGIGWGMYRSNKWPRYSDAKQYELVPQVLLGVRL